MQQASAIEWIKEKGTDSTLLLAEDERIAYLSLTYTGVRSWYSHPFNTPEASDRKKQVEEYFSQGTVSTIVLRKQGLRLERIHGEWSDRAIVVVTSAGNKPPGNLQVEDSYENEGYSVYAGRFGEPVIP